MTVTPSAIDPDAPTPGGGLDQYNYIGPQVGQTPVGSYDSRFYYMSDDFRVQFNPPLDPDELPDADSYWSYVGGNAIYTFVRPSNLPDGWVPYSPPDPEDDHDGDCDHLQSQIDANAASIQANSDEIDHLHSEMDTHSHVSGDVPHTHTFSHDNHQHVTHSGGGTSYYNSTAWATGTTSGPQ